MTNRRPGNAGLWRQLARVLPDTSPEALAAVDKAISLEPRNIDNHDIRVCILAVQNRFTEAQTACCPPIFGPIPFRILRARSAWLLAKTGKRREAITQMREYLAVDQSNYWAWQRLAEWLNEEKDAPGYLAICTRVVALWPSDPLALEFLAHAHIESGGRENLNAAKLEFRRALELDPGRYFAADRLFQLQFTDRSYDPARQTVALIRQQGRLAEAALCDAQLALAAKEGTLSAVDAFLVAAREVMTTPNARRPQIERLREIAKPYHTAVRKLNELLITISRDPNCSEHVPAIAIAMLAESLKWCSAIKIVRQQTLESLAWVSAAKELISVAGKNKQSSRIARFIRRDRAALQKNPDTWGAVSYMYYQSAQYHRVVKWMVDWKTRPNPAPWALLNLGLAFSQLGRPKQAAAAHQHAMHLPPDHVRSRHTIWLAIYRPEFFIPSADGGPSAYSLNPTIEDENRKSGNTLLHIAKLSIAFARARDKNPHVTAADLAPIWTDITSRLHAVRRERILRRACAGIFVKIMVSTRSPKLWLQACGRWISMGIRIR